MSTIVMVILETLCLKHMHCLGFVNLQDTRNEHPNMYSNRQKHSCGSIPDSHVFINHCNWNKNISKI
jgi:hypothetical protein